MAGESNMEKKKTDEGLSWIKLTLLGLAFSTGTGFFLGTSLVIEKAGFASLFLFLLVAFCTYFVFDALARMIAQKSEKGSFRAYSNKAFGRWAGFSHGWMYWLSEMLILGSQLTAIGLFTKFWFPKMDLWIFAAIYAVLGVIVLLLGSQGFEKTEVIFGIIKIVAIVLFIILAILVMTGVLGTENAHTHHPESIREIFTGGFMGMFTALIYAFFAFAGIEVMGLMATDLKNSKEAPKAGKVMISSLAVLFIISIGMAMLLAPLEQINANESPFVTALKDLDMTMFVHLFNGVLIIAGFSSLVASLYSVTRMMYTIADAGDAPKLFTKETKKKIPYWSLVLTITGMMISIVIALLLPKKVYEYITTAGGLMLLYSWLFMVFAARKLLKLTVWGHIKTISAILFILVAAAGTLFEKTARPGFFASFGFIAIIGIAVLIMRSKWKKQKQNSPSHN